VRHQREREASRTAAPSIIVEEEIENHDDVVDKEEGEDMTV